MKKSVAIIFLLILVSVNLSGQNSTMTIREVFDFQPGDIFHYHKCYTHMPGYSGAIRFEVLSRTLSPGNDTICYMLRHFDYVGYYNGSMQYTFNNYNKQVCYTNLDSMVHTLIDTTGMITTPWTLSEQTYTDSALCDSLTYKYRAYYGLLFEPRDIWQTFGRGLGITTHYDDYFYSLPPEHDHWTMVYFKKGPYDCGQAINIMQGTEDAGISSEGVISFPNPATTHLNLEFNVHFASTEKTITLHNTIGQEVLRQIYLAGNSSVTLNISNLPAGVYVMQVTVPGLPSITRKVVKRD